MCSALFTGCIMKFKNTSKVQNPGNSFCFQALGTKHEEKCNFFYYFTENKNLYWAVKKSSVCILLYKLKYLIYNLKDL